MLRALAQIALIALLMVTPAHAARVATQWAQFNDRGWTLIVVQDNFSKTTVCRLRGFKGHAAFINGAFAFRVSEPAFAANATIRIDGGDPIALRDEIPALMARGIPVDSIAVDGLGNDRIWVTAEQVGAGQSLVVQPRIGGRLTRYSLQGYATLREAAARRGCTDVGQFR